MAVEPNALDATYALVPLEEGGEVALLFPPQGGRVVFAGVRATHLDPCRVTLEGALRHEASGEARLDKRTVSLLPDGAGWGTSDARDIYTFANVTTCPNQWSPQDVYGGEYLLELRITDRHGKTGFESIHVRPECSEPDGTTECLCLCRGGYQLGEPCDLDAGAGGEDAGEDAGEGAGAERGVTDGQGAAPGAGGET